MPPARLVTSNDNLDAIRFYQRRGAIDDARKLKPQIPKLGHFAIPLHDEIELELPLTSRPAPCLFTA
jgi:hypothetical protein